MYCFFYILGKSFFLKLLDTINPKKTIAGNAKVFRKIYNVEASQIACQILINENESYVFTDITCKTEIMVESK